MQAVIAILLCFIIALGLFIAYASLGRQQEHAHPHYGGMYDVDTLYRDRLFSWWNYPSRFYYGGNDHAYHHPPHHHAGGHTHNHGTQIVFSQPTTSTPPPPPSAPPAAPKSVHFALPQVVKEGFDDDDDEEQDVVEGLSPSVSVGRGNNLHAPTNLRMNRPNSSSTSNENALTQETARRRASRISFGTGAPSANTLPVDAGANLQAQANGIMQKLNIHTTSTASSSTPSITPSFSVPVIPTPSTSAAAPDVDGFKPYSPETSCGTYNCAE